MTLLWSLLSLLRRDHVYARERVVCTDVKCILPQAVRLMSFSQERDHYSQFVSEAFDSYVSRKEKDGVHGNNPEMQAASELFNRPIEVYVPERGSEQESFCRIS